jgi:ArsR family transcriptional regulator
MDLHAAPPADAATPAAMPFDAMADSAQDAAGLLKALAHEGRLMILCALVAGERSVGELEDLLGARQAAVSQQLARLRLEGLVTCRREGKSMVYALGDPRVARIVGVLHEMFCTVPEPGAASAPAQTRA